MCCLCFPKVEFKVVPVKDIKHLNVSFPIPDVSEYYFSKVRFLVFLHITNSLLSLCDLLVALVTSSLLMFKGSFDTWRKQFSIQPNRLENAHKHFVVLLEFPMFLIPILQWIIFRIVVILEKVSPTQWNLVNAQQKRRQRKTSKKRGRGKKFGLFCIQYLR